MTRIVVLGDLNLDIHAQLPGSLAPGNEAREPITVRSGGSAGTFARTAAKLGASVTFIGAVGTDLMGDLLETSLIQVGVVPHLLRTDLASGAVLAIQQENDRSMVCSRGANDGLTAEWISTSLPRDGHHLHVSGYALLSDKQREAAFRAFSLASQSGMTVSIDPPPASLIRTFGVSRFAEILPEGSWFFPNLSEGQLLSATTDALDVVRSLADRFPVGALTLGAEGAIAWRGDARHVQSTEPLGSVDTTGAGDVFAATFVTRFLQSGDLGQASAAACLAAAAMLQERLTP